MYRRFDEDEKEKFLNASQEDQLTLIEIFIGDTEIKEDTENSENIESETTEKKPVVTNEIVEKTFLQKYMIVSTTLQNHLLQMLLQMRLWV